MLPARVRLVVHVLAYAVGYAVLFPVMMLRGASLRGSATGWYVAFAVVLIPTLVLIRWLAKAPRASSEALAGLIANTAGLIGFFAIANMQSGLVDHPAPTKFTEALYFSIVTWTTLGYGDLQPIEPLQLLAASKR